MTRNINKTWLHFEFFHGISLKENPLETNFQKISWKISISCVSGAATGCSVKIAVLGIFAKFTESPWIHRFSHLCQSLFFNKVAVPETFFKKRLWNRCFPVNFAKFLKTPFLQNTSGWLLLVFVLFLFQIVVIEI